MHNLTAQKMLELNLADSYSNIQTTSALCPHHYSIQAIQPKTSLRGQLDIKTSLRGQLDIKTSLRGQLDIKTSLRGQLDIKTTIRF